MTRWPVVARIRVAAIGSLNHTETLTVIRILMIVILELVHPLHIEHNRALRTIDFELVMILAACCHTGCFKGSNSAARKPRHKDGTIVDGDLTHLITGLATQTVIDFSQNRTLLYKRVHHARNICDLTK